MWFINNILCKNFWLQYIFSGCFPLCALNFIPLRLSFPLNFIWLKLWVSCKTGPVCCGLWCVQERHAALEKMGISVQTSGIKVEQGKHYLVNLNADPSLNELLVYYLKVRWRLCVMWLSWQPPLYHCISDSPSLGLEYRSYILESTALSTCCQSWSLVVVLCSFL